jgi:hypothetical protein
MRGDSSQILTDEYYSNKGAAASLGLAYKWKGLDPNNNTFTSTAINPGFIDTGNFRLVVTEPRNGCKDSDDVLVVFLPVAWGDFHCQSIANKSVVLDWTTLSEDGTSVFEVQRFNVNRFETIGVVSAAGHSDFISNYRFIDERPLSGKNFYRIKMVAENGKNEFSEYCESVINAPKPGAGITQVIIYPNPATTEVSVAVSGVPAEGSTLKVIDQSGRIIRTAELGSNLVTLNIADLTSGLYLIKIEGSGLYEVQKLIKK